MVMAVDHGPEALRMAWVELRLLSERGTNVAALRKSPSGGPAVQRLPWLLITIGFGVSANGFAQMSDQPGAKSEEEKRGNTPPGTSRGGDAPASGAIMDPAGVTKR